MWMNHGITKEVDVSNIAFWLRGAGNSMHNKAGKL